MRAFVIIHHDDVALVGITVGGITRGTLGMTNQDLQTGAWPRLLGDLYESVLNPDLLTPTLAGLSQWLEVDAAHLIGWDTTRFVPRIAVVNEAGLDHVDPDYVRHYSHIDPRRPKMAMVPMGQLARCDQFFDDRFVSQNEFYQKFLLPRGRRYTMGAHLHRDSRFDFYVTFYHSAGRDSFEDHQVHKAQQLVPHLQRVARMLIQHESATVSAQLGQSALDSLDQGVVALDAQGEVLFANRRAEALMRQGNWIVTQERRLRAAAGVGVDLAALIERTLRTGMPDSVLLRRPQGHPDAQHWCSVTICRPPHGDARLTTALHPQMALLVYLSVPNAQRCVTVSQLMQMFGLTQAEARLAQALAQGSSVDEYAHAQGLAMPTVRSQVRSVLDKTQAARQQDLVRMLASIPSVRNPRPAHSPDKMAG